jgi:penicillin-binding protein 2
MPSERWKLKTQHDKWYAGETISVGIGQGAIEVTPLQLARALGGIASGGHMVRPHVVFPDELAPDQLSAIHSTYPGSGDKSVVVNSDNWQTITDGMSAVTGPTGTAAGAHLDGIDFAGKTGTAQVMSHDALARTNKGHNTEPNAWFVGMAPRRNPNIVVAVLWEHGVWGQYSARLAAQVINAYVNKQRVNAGNVMKLASAEKPADSETLPATPDGTGGSAPSTPEPSGGGDR